MGSHQAFHRAVDRLNRCVRNPDERLDSVQAMEKGCLQPSSLGLTICASVLACDPRPVTRQERDPCPPTPHGSVGGSLQNFPDFSSNLICSRPGMLFNFPNL